MNYKTKQAKLIAEMKKELSEFKEIKEECKENNELLKEQILEYEQLTKSFNKTIPRNFFT